MNSSTISKFLKVKIAVLGLIIILAVFLMALFAYVIAPDNSPNANDQQITISNLPPGSKVQFLCVKMNTKKGDNSLLKELFFGFSSEYTRIPVERYEVIGDSITIYEYGSTENAVFVSHYHIVDVVRRVDKRYKIKRSSHQYHYTNLDGSRETMPVLSAEELDEAIHVESELFLLGTDRFGRDLLSRIIIGSRVSISVGLIAVLISLLVGIILGLVGGFFGGIIDKFIMWLINVVWSIPTLLLVIAISMVLGKGFWQIFVAVGLTMWVEVARVVRGQVKSLKEKEFVQAARVLGFSNSRIMFRHILPNTTGPLIVISAANFATAILLEAGLSFLGIGVQPPTPSWGNMIRDHYGYIVVDQAYLAIVPGLAIMLLVWAFTILGYGLRDAFDVKN
ncbi:MAG: ABC transporter permease [Salinivirgaceae bacterium]|nr:ABC transporter permease [Salinivirgaceae bacterium]